MTSFPTSNRSFTPKVDITDTVYADHINALQEEVYALEATINGASATALSNITFSTYTGTFAASLSWGSLFARLNNIETGLVNGWTTSPFIRKVGGDTIEPPSGTTGLTLKTVAGTTDLFVTKNSANAVGFKVDSSAMPKVGTANVLYIGSTEYVALNTYMQSIQTIQGTQGLQGRQGTQGLQGIQGTLVIQGSLGNQGIQGVQGLQGNQGTTGIQGLLGNQGVQGVAGTAAAQGAQGTTGSQGATGTQGLQGRQGTTGGTGATGTTGIQGASGTNGTNGTQGATGTTGAQGLQGIQGNTGTTGSTGIQGPTGLQGTIGTTGSQGTQGIQGSYATYYTVNTKTASTNSTITDATALVVMNVATANNYTIQSTTAFPTGTSLNIVQAGAGQTTILGGGTTSIQSTAATYNAPRLRTRYSAASAIYDGTTWFVFGDIY